MRIWCAAASTGEEPYSIAITAADALGSRADVQILATDIDTRVLEAAQRGVYALDAVERLDFCAMGDARHVSATVMLPAPINGHDRVKVHSLYVPAGGDEAEGREA